jgi:hypothetical protein
MTKTDEQKASTGEVRKRLDSEQKELARHLLAKSGVDFERLDRRELLAAITGLISPFDYALWAVGGFLGAVAYVWLVARFITGLHAADGVGALLAFVVFCLFGLGFALFTAASAIAVYVYRTVDSLIYESFHSVDAIKREIAEFSPSALKKLSRSDLARGTVWIIFLPAVEIVLRRRLKLKLLAAPSAMVLRRAFRLVLPPLPRDQETLQKVPDSKEAVAVDDDSAAVGESMGDELAKELVPKNLSSMLRRIRRFGSVLFGGLALVQAGLLALLAFVFKLVLF